MNIINLSNHEIIRICIYCNYREYIDFGLYNKFMHCKHIHYCSCNRCYNKSDLHCCKCKRNFFSCSYINTNHLCI